MVRRLDKERAARYSSAAALEIFLEETLLKQNEDPFTPKFKYGLVMRFFGLKVASKESIREAFLNTPSRIRAYWLLAKVGSEDQQKEILTETNQIKKEVDLLQLNRLQLKNVLENSDAELWGRIADLFDRELPKPIKIIMENIEARCLVYCLDLKKCVGFCQKY